MALHCQPALVFRHTKSYYLPMNDVYVMENKCLCCEKITVEWHHLKTRKSGGSDHWKNMVPLCREHHQLAHLKHHTYMAIKFDGFRKALIARGWEFNGFLDKWVNFEEVISRTV